MNLNGHYRPPRIDADVTVFAYECPERQPPIFEDAFACRQLDGSKSVVVAVADGITQPSYNEGEIKERLSGAKKVAQLWCDTVTDHVSSVYGNMALQENLLTALSSANTAIRRFNESSGFSYDRHNPRFPDFWREDYYCCTGAAAIIDNNTLSTAVLDDCFASIVSPDNRISFKQGFDLVGAKWIWQFTKGTDVQTKRSIDEWITRARLRNVKGLVNPQGLEMGYGAFTGEPEALSFVAYHQNTLHDGDVVCLGTDGAEPFFDKEGDPDLLAILREDEDSVGRYIVPGQSRAHPSLKERLLVRVLV